MNRSVRNLSVEKQSLKLFNSREPSRYLCIYIEVWVKVQCCDYVSQQTLNPLRPHQLASYKIGAKKRRFAEKIPYPLPHPPREIFSILLTLSAPISDVDNDIVQRRNSDHPGDLSVSSYFTLFIAEDV